MDNFNNTFVFDPYKKLAAMPLEYKPELNTIDLFNDADNYQYW